MAWALEVFRGMEERRLPGETEAAWNLVRDGEVVRKGTGEARRLGLPRPREACPVDACQVRGVGAQVLAALRAFLFSLLHRQGVMEEEAALEAFSLNPLAPLRFLGLYAV